MTQQSEHPRQTPTWRRTIAILALIFGVMTLISGGNVLFGSIASRQAAGDVVPLVLWFNFCAGFFYILAAGGIWWAKPWAFGLSALIAVATGLVAIAFVFQVISGAPFEMRTVGALILRFGVWAAIALTLWLASKR